MVLPGSWVWGLTQASLAHISSAHVFTDELGLSTKLLEEGDSSEARKGTFGAMEESEAQVPPDTSVLGDESPNPGKACG